MFVRLTWRILIMAKRDFRKSFFIGLLGFGAINVPTHER